MAGTGEVVTYRELDERSNRLAQLFRAAGLRPGDHIAFMLENHPLFLAVAWAAHRSGLYYTAISSRLTDRRARVHRRRLRRPGVRLLRRAGRRSPPRSTDATPKRRAAAHAGRRRPTASSPTRRRWPASRATPARRRVPGHATCSTPRAPPAGPRASSPPLSERAARQRRARCCQLVQCLFGAVGRQRLPLAGAALPRRPAALLHDASSGSAARVVVMESFDPEEALALIEKHRVTHQPVGADHVRPDAEAARARRAQQLRPVVAARARSTPPRPARSRSRSR